MSHQHRASYRENLASLQHAQKSGAGVPAYMRWVNRWLGRRIAAMAAVFGASPNMLTLKSAACSVAGLALLCFAQPSVWVGVAVAVLLALGFAFDSADGQLARLTGTGSPAGEWLDHVVDAARTTLVHVVIAFAVWRHDYAASWVGLVALAAAVVATSQFMSQILAEQLAARANAGTLRPAEADARTGAAAGAGTLRSFLLLPIDTGTLCWAFALWGVPVAFGAVYALLCAVLLCYTVVSMMRKYRTLKRVTQHGAPAQSR